MQYPQYPQYPAVPTVPCSTHSTLQYPQYIPCSTHLQYPQYRDCRSTRGYCAVPARVTIINHPECKVSNSAHSVFFTTCPLNEQLHVKGTEVFHKWTESTNGATISPKSLNGESDIDTLCLRSVQRLMKDGASRKKLSPRDIRYQKRAQSKDVPEETKLSNDEDPFKMLVAPPIQESLDSTCKRTEVYARYFKGHFAGSSGNLARETRCQRHQRSDQTIT